MVVRIRTLLAFAVGCALACCTGGRTPDRTDVVSLEIAPAGATVIAGRTLRLGALGLDRDGTALDLTEVVAWSVDGAAALSPTTPGDLTGLRQGRADVSIRYGGLEATLAVSVLPAVLERIEVAPAGPSLALGTTGVLSATALYSDGTRVDASGQATWTSDDPGIAAPTGNQVRAAGIGTTTVRARIDDVEGSVEVMVTAAVLTALQLDPPNPLLPIGLSRVLTATGTFSDNSIQDLTATATWTSLSPGVATVGDTAGTKGRVTALALGAATIRAEHAGIAATTSVSVTAATLQALAITPTNPSIALGTGRQFTATGTFSDGSLQDLTSAVAWGSANPAVATISNGAGTEGLASSVAQGSTTITATLGAISGQTALTVTAATLQSIAVTPATPSIALGTDQAFVATGTYSDASQQDLTDTVTWTSTDTGVATISNAGGNEGLATSTGQGSTTIGATLGAIQGTTTLTVTAAALVSLAVTPQTPSIALGTDRQFTATGTYSDASQQDLTDAVTWGSTNAGVATISNAGGSEGLATSAGLGATTIGASLGAVQDATTLTVTAATLVSIAVTPGAPSVGVGSTVQLTATGTYTDASQQDVTTSATWGTSNGAVATVSNAGGTEGELTGVAAGSATITATIGAVQGSASATVAPLAFRAASSAGEGNGTTTLTVATPAGSVAGDVMVAFVAIRPESAVVTPPAGWTLIRSEVQPAGNSNALHAYRKIVAVGEAADHSWTFSASSGSAAGIVTVSGASTATPIDVENGQSTPSALSHTAPGVSTTRADTLLVSAHGYSSSSGWTPPAGMTEVVDVASQPAGSAGICLAVNWESFAGPGATGDRTATASSQADTGNAILMALRP